MRKINLSVFTGLVLIMMLSCKSQNDTKRISSSKAAGNATTPTYDRSVRRKTLTAKDQEGLTPDSVIQDLQNGNQHFISNSLTLRDDTAMVHKASAGQFPEAFVLSCIDSRIPVEEVFNQGIGDLFVGRIAGNTVNADMLGSMEYGCKVSGAKLIVVMGHEYCGAIKGAIENVKLGNITTMLAKIKPAVVQTQHFPGEHTIKNHDYVEAVAKNNIMITIQDIKQKSPILKEMADKREIKIVGAYYEMDTGKVTFL